MSGDLLAWRRARAILSYAAGERVVAIALHLGVGRATVNDWLRWYAREGAAGLLTAKPGKSVSRLSPTQRDELGRVLDEGPIAAGLETAMWTGRGVAAVIQQRFGVSYHPQSVARLLHEMGFSVQRPRKRLARADAEAQSTWVRERLPGVKKNRGVWRSSRLRGRGILLGGRHAAPDLVARRHAAAPPSPRRCGSGCAPRPHRGRDPPRGSAPPSRRRAEADPAGGSGPQGSGAWRTPARPPGRACRHRGSHGRTGTPSQPPAGRGLSPPDRVVRGTARSGGRAMGPRPERPRGPMGATVASGVGPERRTSKLDSRLSMSDSRPSNDSMATKRREPV